MTRPTVLDNENVALLDLTPSSRDKPAWAIAAEKEVGRQMASLTASVMRRARDDDTTAWDDVRKYVEGLEARLVAVAGPCSLGVGCEQYGVCYADAHGKPEECGKPSFECEALKDARRIADHDKKLWLAAEARIAELEKEKHAALTMIAMLEKRLADAERVIDDLRTDVVSDICVFIDMAPEEDESWESWYFASFDLLSGRVSEIFKRAARAYMEGK